MDPATLAGLILLAGIVIGIVFSLPIAIVIGTASALAAIPLLGLEAAVLVTAQRMFTGINSFPLLAIPLFVLAGVIMNNGGIAGRLVDAAKVLTGRMPASLAQTNVVANAMFGATQVAAAQGLGVSPLWAMGIQNSAAGWAIIAGPARIELAYRMAYAYQRDDTPGPVVSRGALIKVLLPIVLLSLVLWGIVAVIFLPTTS